MTYIVHISFKSFDNFYIESSLNHIYQINKYLQSGFSHKYREKNINYPIIIKKYTVLKSPHIDKKSREQFEWKRYKKSIILQFQEKRFLSFFVLLLKNSTFPGVQVEVNLQTSSFYNSF